MTEQEFRRALGRSLSGADLPDCRKRQVLAQMKGETTMRKSTKFRFAFVLLAILLLTTATVAVAASVFKGTVDWTGQPKGEEVISMPAVTPTPAAQESAAAVPDNAVASVTNSTSLPDNHQTIQPVNTVERLQAVHTLLNEEVTKAGRDLVILSEKSDNPADTLTSRRYTVERKATIGTWEELQALVADTSLPLPAALPEGYGITELRVTYDCRAGGAYTPVSTEERTLSIDGSAIIITRYRASEEHDIVTGYFVQMTNDAGETMYIDARLTQATDDHGFGLWDDEIAQAVTVAGMDNALLVEGSARTQLYLRRALPEAICVINPLMLDDLTSESLDVYADLFIRVQATGLDGDALLAVFAE